MQSTADKQHQCRNTSKQRSSGTRGRCGGPWLCQLRSFRFGRCTLLTVNTKAETESELPPHSGESPNDQFSSQCGLTAASAQPACWTHSLWSEPELPSCCSQQPSADSLQPRSYEQPGSGSAQGCQFDLRIENRENTSECKEQCKNR